MGKTFDLECQDCRESLWIGQSNATGRKYIYFDYIRKKSLETFLFRHYGHELTFVSEPDDAASISVYSDWKTFHYDGDNYYLKSRTSNKKEILENPREPRVEVDQIGSLKRNKEFFDEF